MERGKGAISWQLKRKWLGNDGQKAGDEWFGENRSQSNMEGDGQRVLNDL